MLARYLQAPGRMQAYENAAEQVGILPLSKQGTAVGLGVRAPVHPKKPKNDVGAGHLNPCKKSPAVKAMSRTMYIWLCQRLKQEMFRKEHK